MSVQEKFSKLVDYFQHHPNSLFRISVGVLLIVGGIAGVVLPVLGVWLIPMGLFLLAVDFPWAHRLHVKFNQCARWCADRWRRWRFGERAAPGKDEAHSEPQKNEP